MVVRETSDPTQEAGPAHRDPTIGLRTTITLDDVVGTWFLLDEDGRVVAWSRDLPALVGKERLTRRFEAAELFGAEDQKRLAQALQGVEAESAAPTPPQEVAVATAEGPRAMSCVFTPLRGRGPRMLCLLLPAAEPGERSRRGVARSGSTPVLTARQQEILRLIVDGFSTDEMAARLGLRPHTVRNHVRALLARLGVRSKLDAVVLAFRRGLL